MKEIYKIVLTGGPCAGKTTALDVIREHFIHLGFRVLFVPEAATEMINAGIAPGVIDNVDFQCILTKSMQSKEEITAMIAQSISDEKVLIVCDRGACDNFAYMTSEECHEFIKRMNTNIVALRDDYDAVFHMETAAKASPEIYLANKSSNAARSESTEDAIALDDKLISAWTGHPHLRVIAAEYDFKARLDYLISEIEFITGINGNYEIEKKFLVKYPDTAMLDRLPNAHGVDIKQIYIGSDTRIRRRGEGGNYIYIRTEKHDISPERREEIEERVSAAEFEEAEKASDMYVEKKRYCIAENGKYFELDVYPYSTEYALLEIEMKSEDEKFVIPDYIEVIKEVTDDKRYHNAVIAKNHKIEP